VFENFFRIPGREPRDPRRAGIGLGLPIARRLVEAQGGLIRIETPASGTGASMALRLPAAAVDPDDGRMAQLDEIASPVIGVGGGRA
jgi:signal transduction histidine kinase